MSCRRVRPRLDSGVRTVGAVGAQVVPALVETAINLGNAGVTAVAQIGRAAKPVVEESAAHVHHVVSEHIAPGISASMKTLGSHAAEGADRMSEAVLGPERHLRVTETVGAFGTIAKYIAGINETGEEVPDYYVDYGEVHDPVYYTKHQHDHHHHHHLPEYQDYQYPDYQDFQYRDFSPAYPDSRDSYYDYAQPYIQEEDLIPTQTEKISNNFLYDELSQYYGAEARNIEDMIDRQGQAESGQQTVEEALYIIGQSSPSSQLSLVLILNVAGKNVLGTNVTNRLLPVAAQLTHGLGLIGHGFNTVGGAILGQEKKPHGRLGVGNEVVQVHHQHQERGRPRQVENAPSCTTSKGGVGRCMDIQDCPLLLVDLNVLRGSICFKSLFVPGVCCPNNP